MRVIRTWMMKTALLAGLGLAWMSCVATPLPTPPTAAPANMSLVEGAQPGEFDLSGEPGAITGELLRLRVTSDGASREVPVAMDGSFEALALPAIGPPTLYLEALTLDDDIFLVAVTRGPGTTAVATDAGPDRDMDGSPDVIDCAPDDTTLVGQRCPVVDGDGDGFSPPDDCDDGDASVFPGATELCNGVDDNCDGMIDERCVACTSDAECAAGQTCTRGMCVP